MVPQNTLHANGVPKLDDQTVIGAYSNFDTIIGLSPLPFVRTCHAYCTYCFRWIMFTEKHVQKGSSYTDPNAPVAYLREHPRNY